MNVAAASTLSSARLPTTSRIVKTALVLVFMLSLIHIGLHVVPIRSEMLWPIAAVAFEIGAWFVLINATGLAVALLSWRILAPVFVIGLLLSAWPFLQIGSIQQDMKHQWHESGFEAADLQVPETAEIFWRSLTAARASRIAPQLLPMDIHLYAQEHASKPRPILIDIHGGSWQFGSPSEDEAFASHMARAGYAVFAITYRRAPKHRFPTQLDDVRSAIEWIAAHAPAYNADPARISVVGRSAGGQLAMLASFTGSTVPVCAVVSFYGPTDMGAMYDNPTPTDPIGVRPKFEALFGGPRESMPEKYREASPIAYVRRDLPPLLEIAAGRDRVVRAEFLQKMHAELRAQGATSLLMVLPWADHSFDIVPFGPGNLLSLAYVQSFLVKAQSARCAR